MIKIEKGNLSCAEIEGVISLYSRVIPEHKRDIRYYNWLNKVVYPETITAVCYHNKKVIGHYAIHKSKCQLDNNTEIVIGYGTQAVLDPEYNNSVSIFDISSYCLELAKCDGIQVVYGFPNNNYALIQEKIERWDKIKKIDAVNLNYKKFENNSDLDFSEVNDITDLKKCLDNIKNINPNNKIKIIRDSNYYINRYLKKPTNNYLIYKVTRGKNILGFIFTKYYQDNFYHLVDSLYDNSKVCYNQIVKIFLTTNYKKKTVSIWDVPERIRKDHEESKGFKTHFLSKNLSLKNDVYCRLLDYNLWQLQLGDSDAF